MRIRGSVRIDGTLRSSIDDTRHERLPPREYRNKGMGKYTEFKQDFVGTEGYSVVETIVPWNDNTGGRVKQICYDNHGNIFYRIESSDEYVWDEWKTVAFTV